MTLEEYKTIREKFDDLSFYTQEQERFFKEHPDCPRPKPVDRLSLVMKKEYAQEIIAGTKTVEIRDGYSKKYQDMLIDKDVAAYMDAHWDDELMRLQMIDFLSEVRPVFTIHFYTYNNSWSMDVECIENALIPIVDEEVQYLRDEFHSNEFDELLAELKANNVPEDQRPMFFYFAVGKILERRNI